MNRQVITPLMAFGILCLSGMTAQISGAQEAVPQQDKKPAAGAKAPSVVKLTGQHADQITVALLSLLSYSYYLTGEFDFSRQYAEQTIAQYESLKKPLKDEGLEGQVDRAYDILSWIEQWEKEPIVCTPRELRVLVRQSKPISKRLVVLSFSNIPLTAISSDPNIAVRVTADGQAGEYYFKQKVVVEIALEPLDRSFDATIVFGSPSFPDFQVQMPIHIEVQKPTQEQKTQELQ